MARALTVFEPGAGPAGDRLARWTDALAQVCGRLDADTLGARTLDVRMAFGTVGRVAIGRITASRHRIGLTPARARTAEHPVVKVIVQTAGTAIYQQGGDQVELGPGDGLIYDVGRPHQIISDAASEHLVAIIPRELATARGVPLDRLSRQRFSARTGVGRVAAGVLEATLAALPTLDDAAAAGVATAILDLALAPLAAAPDGKDRLRYRIKALIRERLRDPALGPAQLAAELGCSTRYLHRAFADEPDTITGTIWAMRLDACKDELVRRPDRTISEIAFGWGFSSAAHVSRLFRRRYGVSPRELRRG